jgi:hypothetical protein
MKISKSKLRQIIKEEFSTVRESDWYDDENETRGDRKYADREAGLGDLQSEPRYEGGSPEERLLTLMKAREVLATMSKEKLTALSKSLDAEQVAVLRHILANPMYADAAWEKEVGSQGDEMALEENITPGVQQLMKHHPDAADKIKELAGNGYRASEIKRMLQLR